MTLVSTAPFRLSAIFSVPSLRTHAIEYRAYLRTRSVMDPAKLRAWWSARQGLDGSLAGKTEAEVLSAAGWMRSVAGSGPYLGLFARCGASRTSVDAAVAKTAIHELPSARACTYVLPATDFALGLRVGQTLSDSEMKVARKLGVTDAEVDQLALKVLDALKSGPLEPDQIKAATGTAVRNLGEEGKKKGVTTTLPLALGRLQSAGEIRRIPTNGRLDQQRYRYIRWQPNPLQKFRLTEAEAYVELARRFFDWAAPATLPEFAAFAGLGVKASKEATGPLGLVPCEPDSQLLMTPELRERLNAFQPPRAPQYLLTSSLDGLLLLRRNLRDFLAESDWNKPMATDKGCSSGGTLTELPNNAILDRGRIVGIWEYDPTTASIVWASFVKPDSALKQAVSKTEAFVRDQLGDARSFSLDSPKSRVPRIEALRKLSKT